MTYIEQGGWLIWPIIIASVVAMAIVFVRLWVLRRAAVVSLPMLVITREIAMASPAQAVNLCDRSVLGQLFSEAAQAPPQRSQREAVMAAQGPSVAQRLERNLELLGVIAAVAPLMGLLGTVVGHDRSVCGIEDSWIRGCQCVGRWHWAGPGHHSRGTGSRDSGIDCSSIATTSSSVLPA